MNISTKTSEQNIGSQIQHIKKKKIYIYIYICVCVCVFIYIYIYIYHDQVGFIPDMQD